MKITNSLQARDARYTLEVQADGGDYVFSLLVMPDTDFDATFFGFDVDGEEMLAVNGWLYIVGAVAA